MITLPITVDSKGFYQRNANSFEIRNLLEIDFSRNPVQDLKGISLFLVDKEDVMRADLVTKKMYGYIDPIEKVLKFNGISNPFSINEGDVLTVWDLTSADDNLRNPLDFSKQRNDIRNQYITPEKKSTVDPRYQDFAKRNAAPKPDPTKGNNPALPPNYANFGDQELQIVNGEIVLGAAVSKSFEENDQPQSKSDLIAKIIKNRIKNS